MQNLPLTNYIGGRWIPSSASNAIEIRDPARGELLGSAPDSGPAEVDAAVAAAAAAFDPWRCTPPGERIQPLFRLKALLEQQFAEIAETITRECGKTLAEAKGELRRGIENVEVAAGIPSMMLGQNLEDIASGVDEFMIRQPVGIVAAITPFNFPAMIPLWFLPYAIACGNCFIAKPSERVPLTMHKVFGLIDQIGLPPGVCNLVNGGKITVDALLDHPGVRAISFVGSSPVAKYVYGRGATNGKRVQAQGGAKNPIVILPDADMDMTAQIAADSAFGCAGQRCLAASVAITVGEAGKTFADRIGALASNRRVGFGLDDGIEMGPVITASSRERIASLISVGERAGARVLIDGREAAIDGYPEGHFLRPTILLDVPSGTELDRTEIFGPVLSVRQADSLDEAIELINGASYGNMACLFTSSGAAARKFRHEARVGNIGINVGVAAPMAYFPFSGWKESFYGDLHAQGSDAIDFYTEKKVIVERWPKEWNRRF